MTDPSVSDAIGYMVLLELYQTVRVNRLDEDLVLPTATILTYGLKRNNQVATGVEERLRYAVWKFVTFQRIATRHRANH